MMVHKINENEKENKKIEKLNFPSLFRVLVISYSRLLFLYTNPPLYKTRVGKKKLTKNGLGCLSGLISPKPFCSLTSKGSQTISESPSSTSHHSLHRTFWPTL